MRTFPIGMISEPKHTVSTSPTPDDDSKPGLPGWLLQKFAAEAQAKRELAEECLNAQHKLKQVGALRLAERFLRENGCRVSRKGFLK